MIWVAVFLIVAALSSIGLGIATYEPHEPIEVDRGQWCDLESKHRRD